MGRKKKSETERQARERSRSRDNRGSGQSENSRRQRGEEDGEEGSNSNQQDNSGQNEENNYNQEGEMEEDNQPEEQNGQNAEVDQAEALASEIRSSMIDFFGNIKHEKGLVFTTQDRTKMIKEQARLKKKNASHQKIEWLAESDWNEDEEKTKITRLFERKKQELSGSHPRLFANQTQENFMKDLFLKSSYIYCNEVTEELYRLEMDVLLIVLTEPDARKTRVQELMRRVCAGNSPYMFFGFRFSTYHKLDDSTETKQAYQRFGEALSLDFQKGLAQNATVP